MKLKHIPHFFTLLFLIITLIAVWGATQSDPQFEEAIKKYNYSFKVMVSMSFMERSNGYSSSRTDSKTFIILPEMSSVVVEKNNYNGEITFTTEKSKIYAYVIFFVYLISLICFVKDINTFFEYFKRKYR